MLELLRRILKVLNGRDLAMGIASGVVRCLELLGVFAAALEASRGRYVNGLLVGASVSALVLVRSALRGMLTEALRQKLFGATASSLLQSNVMTSSEATYEAES